MSLSCEALCALHNITGEVLFFNVKKYIKTFPKANYHVRVSAHLAN